MSRLAKKRTCVRSKIPESRRGSGIFDRTHVRWFARRDMVRLLRGAGLEVLRVEPYFTRYRAIRAASMVLSLYVFRDYWARQFLLLAVKPDRPGEGR